MRVVRLEARWGGVQVLPKKHRDGLDGSSVRSTIIGTHPHRQALVASCVDRCSTFNRARTYTQRHTRCTLSRTRLNAIIRFYACLSFCSATLHDEGNHTQANTQRARVYVCVCHVCESPYRTIQRKITYSRTTKQASRYLTQ